MIRRVRVVKDGLSQKVIAGTIAGAITEFLMRFEIEWTKGWETATTVVAFFLAAFLFPEKGDA